MTIMVMIPNSNMNVMLVSLLAFLVVFTVIPNDVVLSFTARSTSSSSIQQQRHRHRQQIGTLQVNYMVPKYVKNEWIPQTEDDLPSAGYDVFGTLIRHGPKPTITRIFQPKEYEQAILKFMVTDNCDYITAQGNMDAYLRNPPDWQYQRMEDMKRGIVKQRDYVTIQTSEVVLVIVWSIIVVALVGRLIYSITNGVDFYDWGFGPFRGSH